MKLSDMFILIKWKSALEFARKIDFFFPSKDFGRNIPKLASGVILRRDSQKKLLIKTKKVMKNFEIKALGLEELSHKETFEVSGGDTVICNYDGSNRLFYAINAVANLFKYIKHWITDDELYVTTIHDDGTRDEPVPWN